MLSARAARLMRGVAAFDGADPLFETAEVLDFGHMAHGGLDRRAHG